VTGSVAALQCICR